MNQQTTKNTVTQSRKRKNGYALRVVRLSPPKHVVKYSVYANLAVYQLEK